MKLACCSLSCILTKTIVPKLPPKLFPPCSAAFPLCPMCTSTAPSEAVLRANARPLRTAPVQTPIAHACLCAERHVLTLRKHLQPLCARCL